MSANTAKILLIEDDANLTTILRDRLGGEGYRVETSSDGERGFNTAMKSACNLIVLDVMLPRKNGLDICRDIRSNGIQIPIIMLTAKVQLLDKLLGLKLGADDYMGKPFEMAELLARIEALLRRNQVYKPDASSCKVFQFGPFEIDFRKAELQKNGKVIDLTGKGFKLLKFFVEHIDEVFTRDQILDSVWDYDTTVTTRTVDVHVALLRHKLEENHVDPHYIQTVWGIGYRFASQGCARSD